MASEKSNSATANLLDLPDECILRVFSSLSATRDALALEATCSKLWQLGKDSMSWTERLKKDFDLNLEATVTGVWPDMQTLYKEISASPADYIRFTGVYTDRGCDEDRYRYWVDNMFTANHWNYFCSKYGNNANCAALLTEACLQDQSHWPIQERERREYIVERCLIAHAAAMGRVGLPTARWSYFEDSLVLERDLMHRRSTAELHSILRDLYQHYLMRTQLGDLLFFSVSPQTQEQIQIEVGRVEEILSDEINASEEDGPSTLAQYGITEVKPDVLIDLELLERLYAEQNSESHHVVGIVEELTVNRMGGFSCPVATGVVFIGNFPTAIKAADQAAHLEAMLEDESCRVFDNLTDGMLVICYSAEGKIPQVIASSRNHAGKWIEFDTEQHGKNATQISPLRPVAWFQFWSREEAHNYYFKLAAGKGPMTGHSVGEEQEECVDSWLEEYQHTDDLVDGPMSLLTPPLAGYESNFIALPARDGGVIVDERLNINKLTFPLKKRHAGNLAVVKLIDQVDLMDEWHDDHDEPNIDVTYVAFKGRNVVLPPEIQLAR